MKKEEAIILFVIFFFILLVLFAIVYLIILNNLRICHDSTPNNECSETKPYFCSNGILIEKASLCGCNYVSKASGDKCVSDFQNEAKNITLNYVLRGEKEQINFTVYKKLYDYTSGISRFISSDKNPTLLDFRLKFINEPYQRELLLPLAMHIKNLARDKEDQARIAVSIVQNIPFGSSNKTILVGGHKIEYQRYPYEVLYDMEGICSEKSELLVFLLREIGYGSAFLYYPQENHEAVGIKCPENAGLDDTGYCFVETTGPAIISDDKTEYTGGIGSLSSIPEVLVASEGISLGENLYEYKDAETLNRIRESSREDGTINFFQHVNFQRIKERYGLITFNSSSYSSYTE